MRWPADGSAAQPMGLRNGARVQITEHAPGMPHVRATIRKMAQLAKAGSHSYAIRNLATRITHGVPSKRTELELHALYKWVRDNIRYRFDPHELEWVQSPARTVLERSGDCDDMSTLLAALAGSLGHPFRFVTVGPHADIQRHIAAEVFVNKHWVTIDPVLEPPATSTRPRTDLGRYGHRAKGAAHLWNDEGQMLAGPTTRRDRMLWTWIPYYPPVGNAATQSGMQRAQPGAYTKPDYRYRSTGTPGPRPRRRSAAGPKPQVLAFALGEVESFPRDEYGNPVYEISGLGFGFLKAIGKAVGGIAKTVTKIPGLDIVAGMVPGGSVAMSALKMGGKLLGGGKKGKKGSAAGMPALPAGAMPAGGGGGGGGGAMPANLATRSDLNDLKKDIREMARLANRDDIEKLFKSAVELGRAQRKLAADTARVKAHAKAKAAHHAKVKAHPAVGRKYGSTARQAFDPKSKVFRVYVPKARPGVSSRRTVTLHGAAGLSGLGLRPQISFSLGAASPGAAQAAVNAVRSFIAANKRPANARLAAVRAFQAQDDLLEDDGLWGPNTRTAAAWYLGVPEDSLPAVAPAYARSKITWHPPAVEQSDAPPAIGPVGPVTALPPPAPPGYPPAPMMQVAPPPVPVASATAQGPRRRRRRRKPGPAPAQGATVPSVPPAPLPGYAEVAHEPVNPGLPPVPPPGAPAAPSSNAYAPPPAYASSSAGAPSGYAMRPSSGGGGYSQPSGGGYVPMPPPPALPPPSGGRFGPELPDSGEILDPWASGEPSSRKWLWIALGYWYLKNRRKAAA